MLTKTVDMLLESDFGSRHSLLVLMGGVVIVGKIIDMHESEHIGTSDDDQVNSAPSDGDHYQNPPIATMEKAWIRSSGQQWNFPAGFLRIRLDQVNAWAVLDDARQPF